MVYFRIEFTRLIDFSRYHLSDYDKPIIRLKTEVTIKVFRIFVQAENASEKVGLEYTVSQVLKIALAYLYSGRPVQARNTLKKLWPPFDQDRIWKLVLATRRRGILRYTRPKMS